MPSEGGSRPNETLAEAGDLLGITLLHYIILAPMRTHIALLTSAFIVNLQKWRSTPAHARETVVFQPKGAVQNAVSNSS